MQVYRPGSISWDDVVERFRAYERYASIAPTTGRMVQLVAVLRDEPRVAALGRNVSHLQLTLWRTEGGEFVSITWSEPDGPCWSGRTGYSVHRMVGTLDSIEHVVVDEPEVIATTLEFLGRAA